MYVGTVGTYIQYSIHYVRVVLLLYKYVLQCMHESVGVCVCNILYANDLRTAV